MNAQAALIWDYDGTLVDSRAKNLSVTRRIVAEVSGRPAESFPALASPDAYARAHVHTTNWQSFYLKQLGLSAAQTERAGGLWAAFQRDAPEPGALIPGITETLERLRHLPHAVVSQNARGEIVRTLDAHGLGERFAKVVGYEDVPFDAQKPHPQGVLDCIALWAELRPAVVVVVGDHEVDCLCARRAAEALAARGAPLAVRSIAAAYLVPPDLKRWRVQPDGVAAHPLDVARLVGGETETGGRNPEAGNG